MQFLVMYRGYVNHEQADKMAKDLEKRLRVIYSIEEDDRETLAVVLLACVEPPRARR